MQSGREGKRFTSHYVSINSMANDIAKSIENNLHPAMYLLIQKERLHPVPQKIHLHPTMYLLILNAVSISKILSSSFTSHYVSINSSRHTPLHHEKQDLHPTMYLLIRFILLTYLVKRIYLHPTMYLLIHFVFP